MSDLEKLIQARRESLLQEQAVHLGVQSGGDSLADAQVSDSFWETATWDDHEVYDHRSGQLEALQWVLERMRR